MRIVPTPKLSTKVAAGLDIAATLAIEQIGFTFRMPAWHPAMLVTVGALTYVLFKWKDEITSAMIGSLGPLQNKNSYSFRKNYPAVLLNAAAQRRSRARPRKHTEPVLLVEQQSVN